MEDNGTILRAANETASGRVRNNSDFQSIRGKKELEKMTYHHKMIV